MIQTTMSNLVDIVWTATEQRLFNKISDNINNNVSDFVWNCCSNHLCLPVDIQISHNLATHIDIQLVHNVRI